MSYCQKCGTKVTEEMSFCPKCGAPVKIEPAPPGMRPKEYRRGEKSEKGEKGEKGEKQEKTEKGEKHEMGFLGPLIGGLILVFLGAAWFVGMTYNYDWRTVWAFFLLLIGIIIIIAAVYAGFALTKRHPKP